MFCSWWQTCSKITLCLVPCILSAAPMPFRTLNPVSMCCPSMISNLSPGRHPRKINAGLKSAGGQVTVWFEGEPGELSEETNDETAADVTLTQVRYTPLGTPHRGTHRCAGNKP